MFDEFKKFAAAGNVIDLAVGVIVGGMFGKIVTAFVDDLINPVLGLGGKADLPILDSSPRKIIAVSIAQC